MTCEVLVAMAKKERPSLRTTAQAKPMSADRPKVLSTCLSLQLLAVTA